MKLIDIFKVPISFVLAVFAIIGGLIVFDDYIDNQIDRKINNLEYIEKISLNIRPFLLFDHSGKIKYDHGAVQYIDSLIVKKTGINKLNEHVDGFEPDFNVSVYFNTLFTTAPLLEYIGSSGSYIKPIQGENKIWHYSIVIFTILPEEPDFLLRLEILK
ncbi:hypothetical protein JW835_07085 [bacterium]|nr:hypothetical protein [bacterium]